MNQNSGIKPWQWIVTVIVIIVLIIIGIMVFSKKSTDQTADTTTPTPQDQASVSANRVIMSDQYPGNVVYISSVQLEKAGWVVIHKDNSGQPGAIIGSAWAEPGPSPVKITLKEAMIDGKVYYAMLHSDDGDKKFDATKDLPLQDTRGSIIMKIFHASSSVGNEVKG